MFYRYFEVTYCSLNIKLSKLLDIWSFHCGDNVKCGLVGYDISNLHRQLPTFWNAASIFMLVCHYLCRDQAILRKMINNMLHVRFLVLTDVLVKIHLVWDMTPCRVVNNYWHFWGAWCLYLQHSSSPRLFGHGRWRQRAHQLTQPHISKTWILNWLQS